MARIPTHPAPPFVRPASDNRCGAPRRCRSGRRPSSPNPGACPNTGLEALEGRLLFSTYTVTSLANSGAGSLRAAVAAAEAHTGADTVTFAAGLHGTIHLTSNDLFASALGIGATGLTVTDALTITGPGAKRITVTGDDTRRVLAIVNAPALSGSGSPAALPVTISGLTIAHGSAGDGGGILNGAASLTLNNVTVMDNRAIGDVNGAVGPIHLSTHVGARGGGILSDAGSLALNGCTVYGNRAYDPNPSAVGATAVGGGVYSIDGPFAASGTTFIYNLAAGASQKVRTVVGVTAEGGAAYVQGNFPKTIRGGSFINNEAYGGAFGGTGYGGGLYADVGSDGLSTTDTLSINGTAFTGNNATGGDGTSTGAVTLGGAKGGAVYSQTTATLITSATFTDNTALAGNRGAGISPDGSVGSAVGSAFYGSGTSLTLTGSVLRHNLAAGGSGASSTTGEVVGLGAATLFLQDQGFPNVSSSITSTTISDNVARGGDRDASAGPLAEAGIANGAGLVNNGGPLTITGSTIRGNASYAGSNGSVTADLVNGQHTAFAGVVDGNILNAAGGTLTLTASTIDGNLSVGGAGASGGLLPGAAVGGGIFSGLGAPLDNASTPSILTVTGSTITANQALSGAAAFGGGIAIAFNGTATLTNTTVKGNLASGTAPGAKSPTGSAVGGGLAVGYQSKITFGAGDSVTANRALGVPGAGGGLAILTSTGGSVAGLTSQVTGNLATVLAANDLYQA